jgi:hypothetical protein
MVISAPLSTFRYKNEVEGYGENSPLAKRRIGFIADEVPADFMWGNVIDQVSVNGILLASVKELDTKINTLSSEQPLTMAAPTFGESTVVLKDHLYLSGDSIGQGKILTGATEVRITFTKKYEFQPIVTISAIDRFVPAFVKDVDETGFTIAMETPIDVDVTLNWHAFAGQSAKLTVSDGTSEDIVLVVPVVEPAPIVTEGSSTEPTVAGESTAAPVVEEPTASEPAPVTEPTTESTAPIEVSTETP